MTVTNRNKVVLVSALTAAALGFAGLAALALPAGAGVQPSLPEISADELVSSALAAQPPAMTGSIAVQNALGLPAVPGLPTDVTNGGSDIRVWFDGDGRSRVALPAPAGEQTIVDDGTTVWRWDSAARTVSKVDRPAHGKPGESGESGESGAMDPATVARQLLAVIRPTSVVAVDGTATVADRPVYELVLAPAPTERTLLREVRVAVDSQTRIPLRLQVLANGSNDPVFSVGFTDIAAGPQDASLFRFSPPPGATVTEPDVRGHGEDGPLGGLRPTFVGDGWDTVVVADVPDDALSRNPGDRQRPDRNVNPRELLDRIGTQVSGEWGSGRLISTAVVSAIVTDDGRLAAGAVPQQVLVEALSR